MAFDEDLQKIVTQILTRSITRKMGLNVTFETTNEENSFFRELVKQTIEAKLNPQLYYFEPMSNKSFSVYYQSYYIGKIKLRGREQHIQILGVRGAIHVFSISSERDYQEYLSKWIKYIKYCLK